MHTGRHSNRRLTAFLPPFFLVFGSVFTICFHHHPSCPALSCIALHCIDSSEHQVPSEMTLAVIGAFDAYMEKQCMLHEVGMSPRTVGIPQLRHSWTLSDKVFQGGCPRGSLGADDEVWSLQMQGLLVSPSRTETTTGDRDRKLHIISCTVDTVLYSSVQSRTSWRHCRLATSPPCDTTPCP